jgi:hypothetical protein
MSDESETSSASPEVLSTPAPAASEPSTPSSPSTQPSTESSSGTAKESMLDAVLKVVPANTEKDALASEATAPPEVQDDTPEDGAEAPEDDDDDDEGEAPVDAGNPRLQKKIRKLLQQRQELRNAVAEYEAMRPVAEIGAQMQAFATANKLTGDDVAKVMQLGAMLRAGDYAGFYEMVAPFVRTAQEYLGIALPKDIRERVKTGQMTEAAARELVRTRMDQRRGQQQFTEQRSEIAARDLQQTQTQVERSVNAFESQLAAADPDYKAKASAIRRTAQAMLLERGGTIQTVQDALNITKAAYDEVNASMRRLRPVPVGTSTRPNGNGSTSPVTAEPRSMMEAALQGLARSRNGSGHP